MQPRRRPHMRTARACMLLAKTAERTFLEPSSSDSESSEFFSVMIWIDVGPLSAETRIKGQGRLPRPSHLLARCAAAAPIQNAKSHRTPHLRQRRRVWGARAWGSVPSRG